MRLRQVTLAVVAVLSAVTTACSSDAGGGNPAASGGDVVSSDSGAPQSGPPDNGTSVDPQILSDVIDGVFMLSGNSQDRTRRVNRATISIMNTDCGGPPLGDWDHTSNRYDQAHYPQLELIAEKSLVEAELPDDGGRLELEGQDPCMTKSLPKQFDWMELDGVWQEATLEVLSGPAMAPTLKSAAKCLSDKTGLKVDPSDPGASFANASDYAKSETKSEAEWDSLNTKHSQAFVECMGNYASAMTKGLEARRPALVERNRELLEAMAVDLAKAGYVP